MSARGERIRFLFREDAGSIDAPTWRYHTGWLLLLLAALTSVWIVLRPYTHHDLATSQFFAPMTIFAFTYLIIFAFAIIFIAIAWVMLSMKRLRDRGEPTGLAGLVPLLALCSGAVHWLQPQVQDIVAIWYVVAIDVALVAAVIWAMVDMGFRPGRGA